MYHDAFRDPGRALGGLRSADWRSAQMRAMTSAARRLGEARYRRDDRCERSCVGKSVPNCENPGPKPSTLEKILDHDLESLSRAYRQALESSRWTATRRAPSTSLRPRPTWTGS